MGLQLHAFLWNNKPDMIARKVVKQNIEKGVVKMTDIGSFISVGCQHFVMGYANLLDCQHFVVGYLNIVGCRTLAAPMT